MINQELELKAETSGERLDKMLVAHLQDLSRVQVQALIQDGHVTVNGKPAKPALKLDPGDTIHVMIPAPEPVVMTAESIALEIIYQDDDVAVINKPAGLVVHPGSGNESGTLANAILARWPAIGESGGEEQRAGIVHRLDKETSGLMVIAKTAVAREKLMAQFQNRTVDKEYVALLERVPKTQTGRIEAPIGRDPKQRKRMAVLRDGKPAITEFSVMQEGFKEGQALVRFKLLTGRTHQIRVHAAFIGAPVVGDRVYGFQRQRLRLKRLFLHAVRLCFDQPTSGQRLCFETPLPLGLQNLVEKLPRD